MPISLRNEIDVSKTCSTYSPGSYIIEPIVLSAIEVAIAIRRRICLLNTPNVELSGAERSEETEKRSFTASA